MLLHDGTRAIDQSHLVRGRPFFYLAWLGVKHQTENELASCCLCHSAMPRLAIITVVGTIVCP